MAIARSGRARTNFYARQGAPDWKTGLTAAQINERDDNGNLLNPNADTDWNKAAAAQYMAIRQAQGQPAYANAHEEMMSKAADSSAADLAGANQNEQKRQYIALSNALGLTSIPLNRKGPVTDPNAGHWDETQGKYVRDVMPSMDQLKAQFFQLPQEQQASIYAKGGAQFMDPNEGAKLLESISKTKTEAFNSGITGMIGQITKGDVQFNPKDRKFYRYMPDPNDPTGSLKTKQEITPLEYNYIQEGMKRGMMPDIDMFSTPPKTTTGTAFSSSVGADTVATLAGAKNAFSAPAPSAPQANMALTPGSTMQPSGFMGTGVNLSPMDFKLLPGDATKAPPPPDAFVRAHDYFATGNAANDASNTLDTVSGLLNNAGSAAADTFVDIANTFPRASNAVSRLIYGNGAPQHQLVPKLSDQRPDDPRWTAIQAEQERQNQEQYPSDHFPLGG